MTADHHRQAVNCYLSWHSNLVHAAIIVRLHLQPASSKKGPWSILLVLSPCSFKSVEAQARLPGIQGARGAYFCGAWAGYGFHEDGIRSSVAVVEKMGGSLPWVPRPTSPKSTLTQRAFSYLLDRFARVAITRGYFRLILPNGSELRYGRMEGSEAPVPKGEEWRGRPPLRATLRIYNMDFFQKVWH